MLLGCNNFRPCTKSGYLRDQYLVPGSWGKNFGHSKNNFPILVTDICKF